MKAVNLLPPELRGSARSPTAGKPAVVSEPGGPGVFVLLGALATCVALLAVWVLAGNTVAQREAELADATTRQREASRRAAQLKPYADFETLATARIATVRDLAASRFDWEQALRDLSRSIPAEVTLARLGGTVSTAGASGGTQLRSAIDAPAIELEGCTRSQRAVARLLSRLRNVDGVTRVALAKSDKEGTSGSAQGPGVTEGFGACGRGTPPTFEIVVFFERAAKASVAPTGPTPAAAPGTAGAAGGAGTAGTAGGAGAPGGSGTAGSAGGSAGSQPAGATAGSSSPQDTPAATPPSTGAPSP